jgi:hypothetical protein
MKKFYVYKTTCLVNGLIYVGKHKVSKKDYNYLGSSKILKDMITSFGRNNFEKIILEECNTEQEAFEKEKFWILKLNSRDPSIGINITSGGTGIGWTEEFNDWYHSDNPFAIEYRNKRSKMSSLKNNEYWSHQGEEKKLKRSKDVIEGNKRWLESLSEEDKKEHQRKQSEAQKEYWNNMDPEKKKIESKKLKQQAIDFHNSLTEEEKRIYDEKRNKGLRNSDVRKVISEKSKAYQESLTDEEKKIYSKKMSNLWTPEKREKMSQFMKGRKSMYDIWVDKYGKEEADIKFIEYKKKISETSKNKNS